ncbi:hypothetical protein NPX13_g10940 [Xylaria arbuscula]|uniref:Uncharacterized protein n=1 Tax=Xylaria arbuscula TaxID=114810 RepID=A0A9W8TH11_9PEZI|nr:hypothetical protein NPX13_g10940 [Xylaria arbuscula]
MRSETGVVVVDVAALLLFGTAVAVADAGENAGADAGVVKRMGGDWPCYRPVAAGLAAAAVAVVAAVRVLRADVADVVGVDDGKKESGPIPAVETFRGPGVDWDGEAAGWESGSAEPGPPPLPPTVEEDAVFCR